MLLFISTALSEKQVTKDSVESEYVSQSCYTGPLESTTEIKPEQKRSADTFHDKMTDTKVETSQTLSMKDALSKDHQNRHLTTENPELSEKGASPPTKMMIVVLLFVIVLLVLFCVLCFNAYDAIVKIPSGFYSFFINYSLNLGVVRIENPIITRTAQRIEYFMTLIGRFCGGTRTTEVNGSIDTANTLQPSASPQEDAIRRGQTEVNDSIDTANTLQPSPSLQVGTNSLKLDVSYVRSSYETSQPRRDSLYELLLG